ncbi:hypothetical protein [Malikia sp.]|uniref:hypothetical protein n=1 Tax=Malikia sp. TaxID=2070706 RepID=UPI0026307E95|nr:hypothetical protein [Malikia sp.]MDD2729758.1 hypothetical protein [Malikia sp.]
MNTFIKTCNFKQVSDSGALEASVDEVLTANEKNVAEYCAGKEKAFNALVGQVMKASKGLIRSSKKCSNLLTLAYTCARTLT